MIIIWWLVSSVTSQLKSCLQMWATIIPLDNSSITYRGYDRQQQEIDATDDSQWRDCSTEIPTPWDSLRLYEQQIEGGGGLVMVRATT